MIRNHNYGGYNSSCGSGSPSMSYITFDDPINLLEEDDFYPEIICRKLIRMEKKQFNFPPITRINRGRG